MIIRMNERVKVLAVYDPETGRTIPHKVNWSGQTHNLDRISYYHRQRFGSTIRHIYHVSNQQYDFRLFVDSDTLSWTLEEVSDGN
jgi:hypothetical protein